MRYRLSRCFVHFLLMKFGPVPSADFTLEMAWCQNVNMKTTEPFLLWDVFPAVSVRLFGLTVSFLENSSVNYYIYILLILQTSIKLVDFAMCLV